jgi:hypothetical protein
LIGSNLSVLAVDSFVSLCMLCFVIGGSGTRICVRVGRQFILCFTPQQMLTRHFFFYIWFRARTLLRWVVFDVSVFALIFSPVRVGSKTTSNWN